MLAEEATVALAVGVALLLLERTAERRQRGRAFGAGVALALGTLFCTVAGYFAVQPMMEAARAGQGPLSFGALHGISTVFYALKVALVATLAWRTAGVSPPNAS